MKRVVIDSSVVITYNIVVVIQYKSVFLVSGSISNNDLAIYLEIWVQQLLFKDKVEGCPNTLLYTFYSLSR